MPYDKQRAEAAAHWERVFAAKRLGLRLCRSPVRSEKIGRLVLSLSQLRELHQRTPSAAERLSVFCCLVRRLAEEIAMAWDPHRNKSPIEGWDTDLPKRQRLWAFPEETLRLDQRRNPAQREAWQRQDHPEGGPDGTPRRSAKLSGAAMSEPAPSPALPIIHLARSGSARRVPRRMSWRSQPAARRRRFRNRPLRSRRQASEPSQRPRAAMAGVRPARCARWAPPRNAGPHVYACLHTLRASPI